MAVAQVAASVEVVAVAAQAVISRYHVSQSSEKIVSGACSCISVGYLVPI